METRDLHELLGMCIDTMSVRRLQGWEYDQAPWADASQSLELSLEERGHAEEGVAAAIISCIEVVCVDLLELSIDALQVSRLKLASKPRFSSHFKPLFCVCFTGRRPRSPGLFQVWI